MLGEGAYGTVFKGLNLLGGNFLAVKVMNLEKLKMMFNLSKDKKSLNLNTEEKKQKYILSKLKKEIALLKNLHHKNIVQY